MLRQLEQGFERALFGARWLLAPFYLGLALSLLVLLVVFAREFMEMVPHALTMNVEQAILTILSLIDLSLAANLVLIVILAGYESFVSKIDNVGHEDRPAWMGTVGFAGLKLKLYASIVAISGIQLLKEFMLIGTDTDRTGLLWMTVIHLTFVATTVFSALTDWLSAKAKKA